MSANPYLPVPAQIVRITAESTGPRPIKTFALDVGDPRLLDFRPGQCVQLSLLGVGESFISYASAPGEGPHPRFSVMRLGKVTSALHRLRVGDCVGVRGPYGNGFPVADWTGRDVVLIGGGCGQAPLRALLFDLLARRDQLGRLQVFYGARTPEEMVYKDEWAALEARDDVDLYRAIDWAPGAVGADAREGWPHVDAEAPDQTQIPAGQTCFTGYVPQLVEAVKPSATGAVAVVCGPPVMIRLTLERLERLGFPPERIYTTLERRMKCGVGLCGRCNLGPLSVCTEGPVFDLARLRTLPEAFA